MRKLFFYPRLAAQNIKNNGKFYIPFMITSTLSASMYFIIYSLKLNESLKNTFGGSTLQAIMAMAMIVAVIFFAVFLFYTQSFLIKRRTKEFGLYSVLGMEKKHICLTCFFETLYIAVISIVGGTALGALLSKLAYLALLKLLQFNTDISYQFNLEAMSSTAIVFGAIFVLLFINTVRIIRKKNVIELLSGENVGEKEPKTKWITAVIGAISLGAGYYIALTTGNPLDAIGLFTLAVILVMIGTYCLFTAGSIVLLKALRKNKGYYYKTKHFVSVSGMMYRMKQNAIGLGNICILCTAVLIMISTTLSLYGGMDDLLRTRFHRNISVIEQNAVAEHRKDVNGTVDGILKEMSITPKNTIKSAQYCVTTLQNGDEFSGKEQGSYAGSDITVIHFMLLKDYNTITGSNETLGKNEALLSVINGSFDSDTMHIGDTDLKVKSTFDGYDIASGNLAYMVHTLLVIVPNTDIINTVYHDMSGEKPTCPAKYEYSFDTDADSDTQIQLYNKLNDAFSEKKYIDNISIESAEESRASFFSLYGGLLFIGIFLGLVFMIATVLIIYYKQISEGYDDKERYKIMQNVGMSKTEIRKSIRSQVLTVFFLPLVTAFVHLGFAFPIITKLLALLNLTNIWIFVIGLLVTAAVFSLIYALVYVLTAKAYYKIVSD